MRKIRKSAALFVDLHQQPIRYQVFMKSVMLDYETIH
ncbi:hypothetical protein SPICUR_05435 [Spiribacter curvatus]|uniref:Uncharacterized protein n=1 Tax=Spiribacter curvatus TaxID=1335757 RepID=U5T749_9GAMM|nr:hypothetical protein SPICUR_05435 [Spiribacter curvatus]